VKICVASSTLVVGLLGCGSPQSIPGAPQTVDAGATIAAGRALWAERKQTCEAYYYDRAVTGMFGTGVLTVQIVNDQPQWRWYIGVDLTSTTKMSVDWIEDMAMLGAHTDAPAASTVEQLWDECAALLAMKNVFLEQPLAVNEDGVPMSCAPIVENCGPSMGPGGPIGLPDCQPQIVLQGFSCGTLQPPQRRDAGIGDAALDADADADAGTDAGADR
jgi:hypothetical protein